MNYTTKLSEDALKDLEEVAHYVQSYAPEKAEPFVHEIVDHFEQVLSQYPRSGKVYLKHIRKLSYNKYTAFYIVDEETQTVEILHIVDLSKPLEARGIYLE